MMNPLKYPVLVLVLCLTASMLVHAEVIDWRGAPGSGASDPFTYSVSSNGISASAKAYVAEMDGTDSIIRGPFFVSDEPLTNGFTRNGAGLGLAISSVETTPDTIVGTERCCGVLRRGINSGEYFSGNTNVEALNFIVFDFGEPVLLRSITVDDVVNSNRDSWVALSNTEPTPGDQLSDILVAATVIIAPDTEASDGPFSTQINSQTAARYILVGTPPVNFPLPNLEFSSNGDIYITSLDVGPSSEPSIRITQGVFEEMGIELVDKRTTAVILDSGNPPADNELSFDILDIEGLVVFPDSGSISIAEFTDLPNSNEKLFLCDAPRYCNLTAGQEYSFRLQLNGQTVSQRSAKIKTTFPLNLYFAPILTSTCDGVCLDNAGLGSFVDETVAFLQGVYPLKDDGLPLGQRIEPGILASQGDPKFANDLWQVAMQRYKRAGAANLFFSPKYTRGIGVVTQNYFSTRGLPGALGAHSPLFRKEVLVAIEGGGEASAHEIGHTFGLPAGLLNFEEYEDNNGDGDVDDPGDKIGNLASGFDVYNIREILAATPTYNFMGASSIVPLEQYWVNTETWRALFELFTQDSSDPELISVTFTIDPLDNIEFFPSLEIEGFPTESLGGSHKIQILDDLGVVTNEFSFTPDYGIYIANYGYQDIGFSLVGAELPFDATAATLRVLGEFDELIVSVDLGEKLIKDYGNWFLNSCTTSATVSSRITVLIDEIAASIQDGTFNQSDIYRLDSIVTVVDSLSESACNFETTPFSQLSDVSISLSLLSSRFSTRFEVSSDTEAPMPRVEGDMLIWDLVSARTINVHDGDGAYITTLPGEATSWTAPAPGNYFLVATNELDWPNWQRSMTVTVDDSASSNAPMPRVDGDMLIWDLVSARTINVHDGDGAYITTLPGEATSWTAPAPGSYFLVATNELDWPNWQRSMTVTVDDSGSSNAPMPRVDGDMLIWDLVSARTINVHDGDGAYITTLPGEATSWTAPAPGSYFLVATNELDWPNWQRSMTVTVRD